MKEKVTLSISIGLVALILTMIIFTQFKTVEKTDITAIETMRETELRDELATWKTKYEEVETKLEERKQKIEEYKQELDNNENAMQLLQSEVVEAEEYLGFTELQGEGIVVTLKDNEDANIEYWDLLFLVNELVSAGAEAISINNERVVATTEIVPVTLVLLESREIVAGVAAISITDIAFDVLSNSLIYAYTLEPSEHFSPSTASALPSIDVEVTPSGVKLIEKLPLN